MMVADEPDVVVVDAVDPADLDAVRALLRAGADEFAAVVAEVFQVQGFAAELDGLPGRYAPPGGCLLVAKVEGQPVGCGAVRDLGDGTCEMKRLYVHPDARKLGAGRRLVAALLERATALGYRRMVLDTLPEMGAAIALYRTFGFRDAAPYWDHPAPHPIFLQRDLGPIPA